MLRALEEHYGLRLAGEAVDLGGGSSLNLLVTGDRRYVVRVHRPHVTAERLGAMHQVRRALLAGGVPCAPPVATLRGETWVRLGERLLEVEAAVEHDAVMDSWERLEVGLPLLGRLHSVLAPLEVGAAGERPLFANHIEPGEMVAATLRATARIRGWAPTAQEERLAGAAEELARGLASAELGARLPRQLVHGDFWDNNVLFREGRIVLVADLDFMGRRARIDDLALTLHFATFTLGGGEAQPDAARLRGLVQRYDRALDGPLSAAERAALPLALARQPLWSIGGWVARLDDEAVARRHLAGTAAELEAGLGILATLGRWRDAFAAP